MVANVFVRIHRSLKRFPFSDQEDKIGSQRFNEFISGNVFLSLCLPLGAPSKGFSFVTNPDALHSFFRDSK